MVYEDSEVLVFKDINPKAPTHSPPLSFAHMHEIFHSLTHSLTHSSSLPHSLTHSLTQAPTHLLLIPKRREGLTQVTPLPTSLTIHISVSLSLPLPLSLSLSPSLYVSHSLCGREGGACWRGLLAAFCGCGARRQQPQGSDPPAPHPETPRGTHAGLHCYLS